MKRGAAAHTWRVPPKKWHAVGTDKLKLRRVRIVSSWVKSKPPNRNNHNTKWCLCPTRLSSEAGRVRTSLTDVIFFA